MTHHPRSARRRTPGGADLFALDAGLVVTDRAGAFFRFSEDGDDPQAVPADVIAALDEQLAARRAAADPRRPFAAGPIALLGDGPGRARLADLIAAGGGTVAATLRDEPAAALATAGDPGEAAELGAELAARGLPSVLGYQEGRLLFADPPRAAAVDITHAQVVSRRLAASRAAAELRAWRAGTGPAAEPAALDDYALLRYLGELTARLHLLLHADAEPPSGGHPLAHPQRCLWRFDLTTGAESRHVVLPFDEPAPGRFA